MRGAFANAPVRGGSTDTTKAHRHAAAGRARFRRPAPVDMWRA